MGTKVKSVRVEMGDSVDIGDTLVINNSCRFSTAKLPTKVSDLANDCCYLTEEALSCAVCGKADKEYVDCCLSAKQDCGDYALNCDLTSGLNSKQDVINDLSTIRANACCGKAAHTTIGTYGDIVTHDACEFQEAGDYALNCTMTACLACKYDASNPCCYQTATEVACTVSPKADKTYVDCCIGELENDIEQLQGRGKFLSNWDATTGKPETDPETLPYEYHTGDYYMVTVVGSNNKRPTGSSYTGEASTTAETSELAEGDMYAYDGTNWLLQSNHGKTVSFANLSGVPSDNACLCSELASKQDNIDDLNTIRTNACCGKSASDTIATYGDVVTHNACEFQVAGDYATNSTLELCLACKQNNISDLDTIRTNACCGACAKTIISGYGDIVSHNASEFQSAGSYAQCCDLTTGLSGKVDKVNGINRIYGTDGSGCQTDYAYSDTVTGNSIAKRDACGNLCVADPTCNSHAATKGYVDDKVDNKVICWGSIAGTLACQTDLQTALNCKQDNISDLNSIRIGAGKGDTAVQPGDLAAVATSGKYCDLTGIPCATTGGTAIAVTNGQVSVCYDNNTIKVNNSDQIYADYTGLQKTCNLVTNFSNADDTHYPSAKAVADIVEGMSGGNMIKEIYDPCNCRKNIYDMDNMYDGSVNKVVTATEKTLWDAKQEALTLPSNPTCGHLVVWGANKKTFVDGGEIPNSATWGCITGTLSNQTDLQNALNCKAQCCDIPTDNCQLANSCGYTTCTGTLTENSLKTVNGCSLVGSGDICIEGGGCSEWGCITGTLCDQTDLQGALDCKADLYSCVNSHGEVSERSISKSSIYFGYDSGIGTIYGTQICNRGCVDAFKECCDGGGCGIHLGADGLCYEQSDENWDVEYGFSLTAGGICSYGNCVTARCYPFDGACRIATLCDLPAESNTKTFYLSSTSDLTTAQAALDWYLAGKNPIIIYSNRAFHVRNKSTTVLSLASLTLPSSGNSYNSIYNQTINIVHSNNTATSINYDNTNTDASTFLSTSKNYSTPYTPQYAGSPATKKYVDDHDTVVSASAPETPSEGTLWYDTTNDVLKTYDGSCWNNAGGDSSNVKAFYITGSTGESNLAAGQAALDWLCSGKSPIISCNGVEFYLSRNCNGCSVFATEIGGTSCNNSSFICYKGVYLYKCEDTTTLKCINISSVSLNPGYLGVGVNYNCPYTPQYPGSPTTKKYVDEKVYTGDTAPATAVEGQIWSDTCSNMVKYYDGSQWNVLTAGGSTGTGDVTGPNSSVDGHIAVFDSTSGKIIKDGGPIPEGKSYCEGVGIKIWDIYCDYSAMRGPAPYGYHVPSKCEYDNLISTFTTTLGITGNKENIVTYLKMPLVGGSRGSSGGTCAAYRTASACSHGWSWAFFARDGSICTGSPANAQAYAIRAFKDEYVVPSSDWCTLYDGSGIAAGAGIFWNCDKGLISISGDGITRTTIMDKNLGATSNNANDTSSYGCYFQWGNNYGFSKYGDVEYGDCVDTTGYGPGNYYCCYLFGTGNPGWTTDYNKNLWGAETGVQEKVNIIDNSGVRCVNGQTGCVDISIPDYHSLEGICVGTYDDYSAMRGPAPYGYHVPSNNEWVEVVQTMVNCLSICKCGENMILYLKLPYGGYSCNCNTSIYCSGSYGKYWTSTYGKNSCAYLMCTYNGGALCNSTTYTSQGFNIRAFSDVSVVPSSDWCVLFDGSSVATGAGIYHNPTKGLISISGDGESWITMMDKNLGATTVYNQWDTISASNVGCFYQRGNNYGFPRSSICCGNIEPVCGLCYGPGNYYCCDTFARTCYSCGWVCMGNDMRGGCTGVVKREGIKNMGVLSVNGQTGDVCITGGVESVDGCTGNVCLKTLNGYGLTGTGNICIPGTVVSGDTGTVYTIKVSNTAPAAGTPNTTITFVTE